MRTIVISSLLSLVMASCWRAGWGGADMPDSGAIGDVDSDADTDENTDSSTVECGLGVWDGDYYVDDYSELEELFGYTAVSGSLSIHSGNEGGFTLDGLECLTEVGGDLSVDVRESDLGGLRNLNSAGTLSLYTLPPGVTDLTDLESLEQLGGLALTGTELESVGGLEQITELQDWLLVTKTPYLEHLDGLSSVTEIGTLVIGIYSESPVAANTSIRHVDGLSNLEAITGGSFGLFFNPALESTDGLLNVQSFAPEKIAIVGNGSLPTCDAMAFLEHIRSTGWDGDVCIKDNLSDGCAGDASGC